MIISHAKRYIFVHIPKTGGTSMALALESRVGKDDILFGDTPKAKKRSKRQKVLTSNGRLWKHSRMADLDGLFDENVIADYFVFTITRNPWDRFVSYYHWLREQNFDHVLVQLARELSFSEFLHHPVNAVALAQDQTADYLIDRAGVYRGDMVFRLETLATELPLLEQKLGIQLGPLPHINASTRQRDYRGFYNDVDAEVIATAYARDIAKYDYSF